MALENFKCLRCGACCRLKGGIVRLTDDDCDRIAAALTLSLDDFLAQWTRLAPDRRSLILNDAHDGACCFYDATLGCRINAVKPQQCKDFPTKWTNPDWKNYCAAALSQTHPTA